ncbi:MAG TPA: Asp-tRNA(Asn)/Glu-tRNA(Gln) amidotransferase subunit GatA [Gemmatimonadales bacterium]|nr:Asp-tRNA(Asn)/Glu-tRNA(Gln) amidotransferase subunit GatA [Gemmatimonadales bacterium]HRZ10586.1 Asp-tRNA(Asn)/Glu-tRNA(Gln) amidotransferase subunit GatA [Gemmatimonadales bacterium]
MSGLTHQANGVAERLRAADARGLNATLHWSEENLAAEAARVEALAGAGATLPLAGMPIALKDNIVTTDAPTTCASRILEGYRSPYDATVVRRLREAGALIAAKANLDEFAMGSSTEHSAFGRVLHPTHPDRVPGGSSGGSAALVAAGVVPAALGSETGGSVRQPASFCGIVGVKPTYGRVSRYGLVAFGSSLDCVSVFGRTVDDASRVLAVIAGQDEQDATTVDAPPMTLEAAPGSLRGIRIGLPAEYFPADLDAGVRAGVDRAAAALRALGAELVPVSLPHSAYAVPTYYVLAPAEAASNLARYDGVRYGVRRIGPAGDLPALYRATRGEGFGAEVRRRILVGTYVLSAGYYDAYYNKAQQVRNLIAADFTKAFAPGGVHFLLTPTTPTPAFRAGEKTADPVSMYLADIFVSAVSLAGLPAMSLPAGLSEGLPVGVQIIAPAFEESRMLALASALEAALGAAGEVR